MNLFHDLRSLFKTGYMQKNSWNLLYTASGRNAKMRSVSFSLFTCIVLAIFILAGIVGFARLIYLGSSYSLAVLGVSQERRENKGLLLKMQFLEKYMHQESTTISHIVAFEDKTRLKYGMDPISSDVRKAGVGGFPSREEVLISSLMDPVLMKAESVKLQFSSLLRQAELQESTFTQTSENILRMHSRWSRRPSIWPTNGRLTSTFGYRYHPFTGYRLLHEGLDIANKPWTPVYVTADGLVKEVSSRSHFGNLIKVSHLNGEIVTYYAHLNKASVVEGQYVKRGELIGYMGNTGRSTGPHLHYEVHLNGRPVNPMSFILSTDQIVD